MPTWRRAAFRTPPCLTCCSRTSFCLVLAGRAGCATAEDMQARRRAFREGPGAHFSWFGTESTSSRVALSDIAKPRPVFDAICRRGRYPFAMYYCSNPRNRWSPVEDSCSSRLILVIRFVASLSPLSALCQTVHFEEAPLSLRSSTHKSGQAMERCFGFNLSITF